MTYETFVVVVGRATSQDSPIMSRELRTYFFNGVSSSGVGQFQFIVSVVRGVSASRGEYVWRFLGSVFWLRLLVVDISLVRRYLLVVVVFMAVFVRLHVVFPMVFLRIVGLFLSVERELPCFFRSFLWLCLGVFGRTSSVGSVIVTIVVHRVFCVSPGVSFYFLNLLGYVAGFREILFLVRLCKGLRAFNLLFCRVFRRIIVWFRRGYEWGKWQFDFQIRGLVRSGCL